MKHVKVIVLCLLLIPAYIFTDVSVIHAAGTPSLVTVTSPQPAQEELSVQIDGSVSKQVGKGNILFLGGDFTEISVNNGSTVQRSNLAVIDLQNRSVSSWEIDVNGAVEDMVIRNNTLYIAGQFTEVEGEEREYVAVFDIENQELLDTRYSIDGPVYALERYNQTLFLGGNFTEVNDLERTRLASIDLSNGQFNQWSPVANDIVYEMLVHEDRLYVGGAFTQINQKPRQYIAAFILPGGELSQWNPEVEDVVRRMSVEGGQIVVEGETVGVGGGPDTASRTEYTLAPDTTDADTEGPLAINVTTYPGDDPVGEAAIAGLQIDREELGFAIPTLGDILTFAIRAFFVIAGLAALFYLLLGAFAWVTSGGDKDSVGAARDKIQAAIVGLIMMVVVLGIVWTLEQIVFSERICLGLSCPVTVPSLLEPIGTE